MCPAMAADHPVTAFIAWCGLIAFFNGRAIEIHHELQKYHVQRRWNL